MVYRIGERVKTRQRRLLETASLLLGSFIILIASTAYAVYMQESPAFGSPDISTSKARASDSAGSIPTSRQGKTINQNNSKPPVANSQNILQDIVCNNGGPIHKGLSGSIMPQLRKLAEYESLCAGAVAERMMLFTNTPQTTSESISYANDLAISLREYATFGISPIVIMEPVGSSGFVDFSEYLSGAYDVTLDTYFATLKAQGITDAVMGMWVPFPESNIPEWNNVNADQVAACITKTTQFQKKYFPGSKTSVLFDSKSYPSASSWEGGAYLSLAPYVKNIPKGLIDSFGLQGYPWPDSDPDYNAAHFLNPDLVRDAANLLGVREVWLSTGTFSEGTAWDGLRYKLTPTERQKILADILNQANQLRSSGYEVAVHIFAEDKLQTTEGNNWSYWSNGQFLSSASAPVFAKFANDVRASGMQLWLFDVL